MNAWLQRAGTSSRPMDAWLQADFKESETQVANHTWIPQHARLMYPTHPVYLCGNFRRSEL